MDGGFRGFSPNRRGATGALRGTAGVVNFLVEAAQTVWERGSPHLLFRKPSRARL